MQVSEEYANMRFHKALERVTALSSRGNLRMQEEEPWQKIKSEDPADVEKAKAVLVEVRRGNRHGRTGRQHIV